MIWSRSEQWMLTGDDKGYIKYWQTNMNNVKMFQGHIEAIRGLRYKNQTLIYHTCFSFHVIRICVLLSMIFAYKSILNNLLIYIKLVNNKQIKNLIYKIIQNECCIKKFIPIKSFKQKLCQFFFILLTN